MSDLTKEIQDSLSETTLSPNNNATFHHRPPTKSGGRNMQDSSFSFGGDQWDDHPLRTATRVKNPPGGKSSGIF